MTDTTKQQTTEKIERALEPPNLDAQELDEIIRTGTAMFAVDSDGTRRLISRAQWDPAYVPKA